MMESIKDRGLKRKEVEILLGISRSTFYRLIESGRLKFYRINMEYRIKLSEIEHFSKEHSD